MKVCISCGKQTKDFVEFNCPDCDELICRCISCRTMVNKYECSSCGFQGP